MQYDEVVSTKLDFGAVARLLILGVINGGATPNMTKCQDLAAYILAQKLFETQWAHAPVYILYNQCYSSAPV